MKKEFSQVMIYLDKPSYDEFKVQCAEDDINMAAAARLAIYAYLGKQPKDIWGLMRRNLAKYNYKNKSEE